LKRTQYINPGKLRDAYAVQDTDGLWVICKVYDGHMDVSPYGWHDKATAERHAQTLREALC
jgi:hypothetical protein